MASKNQKIALGTVQFGLDYGISNDKGKTNSEEVSKILNVAHLEGIRLLDTAQAYGDSEKVIGRLHENRFRIVTKINPDEAEAKSAEVLVQHSLENLGVNSIYGLLFHSANSASENPKIVSQLKDLQKQGIIQKVGFSVYTPNELSQLILKYGIPDIIQIPYSHLDQRFERLAIDLHEEGVEIHTRSTFLQGLFFVDPEDLPDFFEPITPYLNRLRNTFFDSTQLAQALLNFSLSKDFIDHVVIGVNSESQLIQNINFSEISSFDLPEPPRKIPENILRPNLWPIS
ncbi:aldo/keto reductase [Schleiferiaceae bacterium]|nr:aldo/keto reductase [Schleiferiaceae bacterium]